MSWVSVNEAYVLAAMPSELGPVYATWLVDHPEKAERLWELRRRVIEQVAAGGDYGELWGEYDRAFRQAVQRRQGLGRGTR